MIEPDAFCIWKFVDIMKTRIQIYRKFLLKKTENFQIQNSDIFHISAQNVDCEYSLELPHWGSSNEYQQSIFWAEIRKIIIPLETPSTV